MSATHWRDRHGTLRYDDQEPKSPIRKDQYGILRYHSTSPRSMSSSSESSSSSPSESSDAPTILMTPEQKQPQPRQQQRVGGGSAFELQGFMDHLDDEPDDEPKYIDPEKNDKMVRVLKEIKGFIDDVCSSEGDLFASDIASCFGSKEHMNLDPPQTLSRGGLKKLGKGLRVHIMRFQKVWGDLHSNLDELQSLSGDTIPEAVYSMNQYERILVVQEETVEEKVKAKRVLSEVKNSSAVKNALARMSRSERARGEDEYLAAGL